MPVKTSRQLERQLTLGTAGNSSMGAGVAFVLSAATAVIEIDDVSSAEGAGVMPHAIERAGSAPAALQACLPRQEQAQPCPCKLLGRFGRLDILIINAGFPRNAGLAALAPDQWQIVPDIDLTRLFLGARKAVENPGRQVRNPRHLATAGEVTHMPEALNCLLALSSYGRIGQSEDVFRAAAWLASDYVTGTALSVKRGILLDLGFHAHG
ncbi:SDR family oxidoreductase [Belnapia sp. T18]|uniref:SDR family oxidoreductase n=1 Tax=Belnapia arida TaxID=2804533 RepID=A0ABS1U779_9PROT|nr:SDR family oxidoreductase [Belnapia arida]MBL6080532.1 SDR family oxidoreductase [Belnapia arida]